LYYCLISGVVIAMGITAAGCSREDEGNGPKETDTVLHEDEPKAGDTVLYPGHILRSEGDELQGDLQDVDASLVVHSNGCIGAVVDGVERYPIWPQDTKISEVVHEEYRIEIPGGHVIETSTDSPALIKASAIVDTEQTLFGADPNREAFVDAYRDDWAPVSLMIKYCSLDGVGPVVFPDSAKIETVK
jgi:hypothetical protein